MTDADLLRLSREHLETVDALVAMFADSRQRLLVEFQIKQLRLALKSYERRAEKGTDASP